MDVEQQLQADWKVGKVQLFGRVETEGVVGQEEGAVGVRAAH